MNDPHRARRKSSGLPLRHPHRATQAMSPHLRAIAMPFPVHSAEAWMGDAWLSVLPE